MHTNQRKSTLTIIKGREMENKENPIKHPVGTATLHKLTFSSYCFSASIWVSKLSSAQSPLFSACPCPGSHPCCSSAWVLLPLPLCPHILPVLWGNFKPPLPKVLWFLNQKLFRFLGSDLKSLLVSLSLALNDCPRPSLYLTPSLLLSQVSELIIDAKMKLTL